MEMAEPSMEIGDNTIFTLEPSDNLVSTIGFDRLKDSLNKYKIIINTVPMLIFKQEELKNIKSDTLIIDLASKPGGIDFNAAKYMGLKTIHALSLPGKYSPQTAAEFIENAINNTLI